MTAHWGQVVRQFIAIKMASQKRAGTKLGSKASQHSLLLVIHFESGF
jgi:hypothetical protein